MNIMKKQIIQIFSDNPFRKEFYLSENEDKYECIELYTNGQLMFHCFYKNDICTGEYKKWYKNGQLCRHCFYYSEKRNGEYKEWYDNGEILDHFFYRKGDEVEMPDNIKEGYILVDGKYYPDAGDIQ